MAAVAASGEGNVLFDIGLWQPKHQIRFVIDFPHDIFARVTLGGSRCETGEGGARFAGNGRGVFVVIRVAVIKDEKNVQSQYSAWCQSNGHRR